MLCCVVLCLFRFAITVGGRRGARAAAAARGERQCAAGCWCRWRADDADAARYGSGCLGHCSNEPVSNHLGLCCLLFSVTLSPSAHLVHLSHSPCCILSHDRFTSCPVRRLFHQINLDLPPPHARRQAVGRRSRHARSAAAARSDGLRAPRGQSAAARV